MPSRPPAPLRVARLEDRLTPAGTFLDYSFGTNGQVPLTGLLNSVSGQVIRPDGSVVLAGPTGTASTDFGVLRLLPNGIPDPGFGTNGLAVVAFDLVGPGTGTDVPNTLAVAADGSVVVAGTALGADGKNVTAVARLTPAGRLDPTFDGDGKFTFALGTPSPTSNGVYALAVRPDGSTLLAGFGGQTSTRERELTAARLTPAGAIDPGYGTAGRVTEPDGETPAFDPQGRLLVFRRMRSVGPFEGVVARYDSNGRVDAGYGTGGQTSVGSFDTQSLRGFNFPLTPLADGSVLFGFDGRLGSSSSYDYSTRRLGPDGTPDLGFGDSGVVTIIQSDTVAEAADGRLIGIRAGANFATDPVIALTRDGKPDPTFGDGGAIGQSLVTTPVGYVSLAAGADPRTFTLVGFAAQNQLVIQRLITSTAGLPTVSPVADQTALSPGRAIGPITFAVGDATTPADQLVVTATSSDPAMPAAAGIALGGSGANRTITLTPAATAAGRSAVIAISVRAAGQPPTTTTFTVRVRGPEVAAGLADGTVRTLYPDGTPAGSRSAFGQPLPSGPRVAAVDVNRDGVLDLVVGTGPGVRTRVRVLNGATGAELLALDPFEESFTGGVYVAAVATGASGTRLAITPDEGGGPRVRLFDLNSPEAQRVFDPSLPPLQLAQVADFFAIDDLNFRGGARAAFGDVSGDGSPDLIVSAGFGGGPRIAVYDGRVAGAAPVKLVGDFFAFEETLRNGAFVAAGDLDGDGKADLIFGGGPGGGPRVRAISGADLLAGGRQTTLANFFAGDPNARSGVRVAAKNLDGDNRADIVTGSGPGGARVAGYFGKALSPSGAAAAAFDVDLGGTGGVFVG